MFRHQMILHVAESAIPTKGRSVASTAASMGNVTRKFGLILRKDLPHPQSRTCAYWQESKASCVVTYAGQC